MFSLIMQCKFTSKQIGYPYSMTPGSILVAPSVSIESNKRNLYVIDVTQLEFKQWIYFESEL